MKQTFQILPNVRGVSLAALCVATACGDSNPQIAPDGAVQPGPAYLVHTAVQPDQDRLNYFTVVDTVADAMQLDYAQSLELPGRPRMYAQAGIGFFAIGNGEDVTITRYELGKDGALVKDRTISLQSYGVTSMAPQGVLFVSATKAYYKDPGQAQIIVWNPSAMSIERAIDLPADLIQQDWITNFSKWVRRDGGAYLAVTWYTRQYDRVRPGTALVRIDEATDEVTVTHDARCRGISTTASVGGTLYFFSDVINAFGHAVYPGDAGQQDCILRIVPGATTFDSSYVGTMAGALEAHETGTVVAVSGDGEAWVQVADLNVTPRTPGTTYGQWYGGGWTWAHMPLATLSNDVRIAGPAGAYSGFTLVDGDRFFVSQTAADYSQTTLMDLSGGTPVAGLSFPGFALDVAQIR